MAEEVVLPTVSAWEKIQQTINRPTRGNPFLADGPLFNLGDQMFWARITGDDGDDGFEWVEAQMNEGGAFEDVENGRKSDYLGSAYEVNGMIVDDGTYVLLHLYSGPVYAFVAPIPIGQYVGETYNMVAQNTGGMSFPKLHGMLD